MSRLSLTALEGQHVQVHVTGDRPRAASGRVVQGELLDHMADADGHPITITLRTNDGARLLLPWRVIEYIRVADQ